ncbi:MAG TPA: threonine/serine exporter [Clostridiales bacterium]|nr:threonine/serine exporter [Clostridiales bacterium]
MDREWDLILTSAMDIGKAMLESGGEVHRVEDTIHRICIAYGATGAEVFSIVSLITATASTPQGIHVSQSRRVYASSNNMDRLERLNALSRKICREKTPPHEIPALLAGVLSSRPYSKWCKLLGAMLASGGFAVFFGGTWLDGMMSAAIGLGITLLGMFIPEGINQAVQITLYSFLSGITSLLLAACGLIHNSDKVMIGTIMLMIPGVAFGNALREILKGDTATGMLRLIQSVILATTIAAGFALALVIGGMLL